MDSAAKEFLIGALMMLVCGPVAFILGGIGYMIAKPNLMKWIDVAIMAAFSTVPAMVMGAATGGEYRLSGAGWMGFIGGVIIAQVEIRKNDQIWPD